MDAVFDSKKIWRWLAKHWGFCAIYIDAMRKARIQKVLKAGSGQGHGKWLVVLTNSQRDTLLTLVADRMMALGSCRPPAERICGHLAVPAGLIAALDDAEWFSDQWSWPPSDEALRKRNVAPKSSSES